MALAAAIAATRAQAPAGHAQLVIIVDGLRPDYVTESVMPRLTRLGQRGIVFTAHHSVFPTVTRVNASSIATGTYPEAHGLLGNTIFIPSVNLGRGLDTGNRENLEAVARAEHQLLTAPSLGEILQSSGRKVLAVGSGTSGSTFLLNHTVAGGAIVHNDFVRPAAIEEQVVRAIGATPPHATPNAAQNRRAVDAYLKWGLDAVHPDVTLMWLSDPDTTAHAKGIGVPVTLEALTLVDAEIGRIEDTLRARGLLDRTNIFVTSDHGFSTHTGTLKLDALVAPFAKTGADGTRDIVVAEGAIYVRGGPDPARVAAIVASLQRSPAVGAIFTRPTGRGSAEGVVAGTLSFDVARWNHPRAGDILVSANWGREKNEAGWEGTSTLNGVAGHGAASPYDIHNTLIAAGPDLREHAVSGVPTSNVDLAPTLLRLIGLEPLKTMTGRVIAEALRGGPSPSTIAVQKSAETVKTPDGSYTLVAHISTAAGHRYLDDTQVTRAK